VREEWEAAARREIRGLRAGEENDERRRLGGRSDEDDKWECSQEGGKERGSENDRPNSIFALEIWLQPSRGS